MAGLGWIDWTLLGVLAVSVLVGLWRGLVFELMSLVGWVVAYVAAQAFGPLLAAALPVGAADAPWRPLAGFGLCFVLVLVLWSLMARLVQMLLRATPLTLIDRMLGAVFGLLRGALLLVVMATLLAYTPALRSQPWQDSRSAAVLAKVMQELRPLLPDALLRHWPA